MIFTLNGITFTQVSNTHKLNNQILFDQYFTLSKWYPFIGVQSKLAKCHIASSFWALRIQIVLIIWAQKAKNWLKYHKISQHTHGFFLKFHFHLASLTKTRVCQVHEGSALATACTEFNHIFEISEFHIRCLICLTPKVLINNKTYSVIKVHTGVSSVS